MGCSTSSLPSELPEKLSWTRPDFDELCTKGENSLKILNEFKHGVLSSWDRLCAKFSVKNLQPDTVYLAVLVGFSHEGSGDFMAIDLHLAQTLPGYSKIQINSPELSEICLLWEDFCNELLAAIPKIHSVQEDIIQTAEVYYQVMQDKGKNTAGGEIDKAVEDAVRQNLKILSDGADFFHEVLGKVIIWVEKLNKLFASLDQDKTNKIHAFAKRHQGESIFVIMNKDLSGLQGFNS